MLMWTVAISTRTFTLIHSVISIVKFISMIQCHDSLYYGIWEHFTSCNILNVGLFFFCLSLQ